MLHLDESLPEEFRDTLEAAGNRLRPFVDKIVWFSSVTSTNTVAGMLAERGAREGTVVIADEQTAGRGRHGRHWSSPAGAGLYMSIVLRPSLSLSARITILAAVAMVDGIRAATGLPVQVKWPNDLYVGPRKLGGILAESAIDSGAGHVVLGCGINVCASSYPPDVAARATSIETELGRAVDRGAVLVECLAAFRHRYDALTAGRFTEIVAAWRAHVALTLGRTVEWDTDGNTRRGIAESVDDTGALIVRTATGTERLISGEIRWV